LNFFPGSQADGDDALDGGAGADDLRGDPALTDGVTWSTVGRDATLRPRRCMADRHATVRAGEGPPAQEVEGETGRKAIGKPWHRFDANAVQRNRDCNKRPLDVTKSLQTRFRGTVSGCA